MTEVSDIGGYHAHVYYDAETLDRARVVCEALRDRFGATMGRMHERNVGPHTMWSCQLIFQAEQFGELVPWLNVHRDGLIVFIHPLTGDDIYDHRDAPIWLGESVPLNLDALS